MSGEMAFRKDCEECGRSFLSPDRTTKVCLRCAGKVRQGPQQETVTRNGLSPKASAKIKKSIVKGPTPGPADGPASQVLKEIATKGIQDEVTKHKVQKESNEKEKVGKTEAQTTPDRTGEEIEPTKAQIQEIVERYQIYVQGMERPQNGRRRTIAVAMGLPYRTVVLALRQWNQQQAQSKELTREERFSVEKAYFNYLERKNSFKEIKEQITQETGLSAWEVSRYLDILHDGEEKLRNISNVSLEQETAILAEYQKYLTDSGLPSSFLHPLIAERTGVTPKQVHKVLLSYRLSRFREKWS